MDASRHKAMFAEVVGISNPDGRSFVFLVLFLSSLGWFSDTLFNLLQAMLGNMGWQVWSYYLIGICPFFAVSGWGWSRWQAAKSRKVRLRATTQDVDPHAGVILFLSKVPEQYDDRLESGDASVLDAERFAWKMCQYGLEKHRTRLRKVWVVCSSASACQYKYFASLFQPLFDGVEFEQVGTESGVDFEEMEAVVSTIEDVLHALPHDMDESDVMIDITGGQKPNSIAGAMVTLVNAGREFQYVQTNEPHAVKTYAYQVSAIGRKIERNT